MTAANIETGLGQLPKSVFFYLRQFLLDEHYYGSLKNYLTRSGLVLEKDGYQIPLNSVKELEITKELLEKLSQANVEARESEACG